MTLISCITRISLFTLALLAITFLGGCVRSLEPVLKSDQLITDELLVGKWTSKDGKESVEIAAANDSKEFKVIFTDRENKKGRFVGRLGEIKNLKIFEYRAEDLGNELPEYNKAMLVPTFSFLVVQQTDPEIVFAAMSYDWFKKYQADHPEELAVKKLGADNLIITASTDDLQKFLLRHIADTRAMGEPQTYVYSGAAKKKNP